MGMGRITLIYGLALSSIFFAFSCGGDSVYLRSPSDRNGGGVQNILPPPTPDALKISLATDIDDNGNRTPSISISLKDEDSIGAKWSNQIGERFRVVIGDTAFLVALNSETGIFESVATPPISLSAFANLFDKPIHLTDLSGTTIGVPVLEPRSPLALSDFSIPFPSFSNRRPISRCRLDSQDPTSPGVYWNASSPAQFEIQFDGIPYSIADNGYWRPAADLFSFYFDANDMFDADIVSTILGPEPVSVGLVRYYNDRRIRITTTLERELTVEAFALQSAYYDLYYVGNCRP